MYFRILRRLLRADISSRVFEPGWLPAGSQGSIIQIHVADLVVQGKSCYPWHREHTDGSDSTSLRWNAGFGW